jgi:hypothetical protein
MNFKKFIEYVMFFFLLHCLTPSAPCAPLALAGLDGADCFELGAAVKVCSCLVCAVVLLIVYVTRAAR